MFHSETLAGWSAAATGWPAVDLPEAVRASLPGCAVITRSPKPSIVSFLLKSILNVMPRRVCALGPPPWWQIGGKPRASDAVMHMRCRCIGQSLHDGIEYRFQRCLMHVLRYCVKLDDGLRGNREQSTSADILWLIILRYKFLIQAI